MFGPNFVRGIVVIGANDVVNPAVETDKYSPIFRITILNADQSKQVHVVKRGHGKGYTGAETVLDCEDRCALAYGGAQIVLIKRLEGVRGLGPAVAA